MAHVLDGVEGFGIERLDEGADFVHALAGHEGDEDADGSARAEGVLLGDAEAGRGELLHEIADGLVGDDADERPADGEVFLDEHADERAEGEADGIGDVGGQLLVAGQDARNDGDPNENFEEPAGGGKELASARDEGDAERAHADVANAGDNDEEAGKGEVHGLDFYHRGGRNSSSAAARRNET